MIERNGANGTELPLAGVKVLDLTRLLPGGFCTLLLADLGAEVLKVEDTGPGDYLRWTPPLYDNGPQGASSAAFIGLNRNKSSLKVDLRKEEGKEVFLKLVERFDVLIDSFRPGTLERLGLPYDLLREHNKGLIWCTISGFGQEGPLRDRAGHDINYLATCGLLALSGEQDGPPALSAGQIADLGGGALLACVAILAALRERDGGNGKAGSGEGQRIDISMTDGALSWLTMVAASYLCDRKPRRRGGLELGGGLICYRVYRCADGYVALGALEPKFWQSFCEAVGKGHLVSHQFDRPGSPAHRELEELFATRTREEWARLGEERDCCLFPVLELEEALESDHVQERNLVIEQEQPGLERPVQVLGPPFKLSRTPPNPHRRPAPGPGEQTEEVLAWLGYSSDQIAALQAAGVVVGASPTGAKAGS
jgi:alpha-methylacyl-CoA racemase